MGEEQSIGSHNHNPGFSVLKLLLLKMPCPKQSGYGFAIVDLARHGLLDGRFQRQPVDFDHFMPLVLTGHAAQVPRQVEVDGFRKNPGGTEDGAQVVPLSGLAAGFLHQFAPRSVCRRFFGFQATGRQFPHPTVGRRPELAQQADLPLGIQCDHGRPTGVVDDFVPRRVAVGQQNLLHIYRDYAALEYGFNLVHGSLCFCLAIVRASIMASTAVHLESLNNMQRKAAGFGEPVPDGPLRAGPLLVIAGAGTGKTNTLAHRVAHLVLNGVDPSRIMLLTFTRRAAMEMRRRSLEILRKAMDDTLGGKSQAIAQRLTWTGTFHSLGNRLLRHYAAQLRLDPGFTVIDRSDSADLLDQIRTELGFAAKEQRFPRKETCLAIYSHRVNTQRPLAETLQKQFSWCVQWEQDLSKLFRSYVERKQKLALLDYDDLLLYWHLLVSEPRLAQHVSGHFDHILVDEYQDTNTLQARILEALRPDGSGLTVVGDDAQAIYSFRAAEVENILGFAQRFTPPAEVVPLGQNYRSTQTVLDASNALMAEAPRQFRKHLLAVRGGGTMPRYVTTDDLASQAEYVALQVLQRREAGTALRRQAVLFRTASHSDLLEVELARRKIPFVKYGGLKFLEAAHVKDMIAVLRWADNPRNSLAAFRVLQLLPGMGPVNARAVLQAQTDAGNSISALAAIKVPAPSERDYQRLTELLGKLAEPGRQWPGQVRLVREWYQPHLERIFDHFHTRIGDLDQLEQLSSQFPSRERFLTELTLDPPQATSDLAGKASQDEDYLVLSTVHSAKGMEWDTVFLLNVVDGSFPNEFATGKQEMIDEERRLLYVAMTRARNELQLIHPLKFPLTQQSPRGDAHVYGGRSRFMTEKVLKCLEPASFTGSHLNDARLSSADGPISIDATNKLREMW